MSKSTFQDADCKKEELNIIVDEWKLNININPILYLKHSFTRKMGFRLNFVPVIY